MHAGLFGCFDNPSNSNMDYRIFNVRISQCVIILHAYTQWGPRFIVSSEGLLVVESAQNLFPEKSQEGRKSPARKRCLKASTNKHCDWRERERVCVCVCVCVYTDFPCTSLYPPPPPPPTNPPSLPEPRWGMYVC